jgi:putative hemolysin
MDPDPSTFSLVQLLLDIALVFFFIGLGTIFVAAEIALVTLREGQVRQLAGRGKRGARVAHLAKDPNRFLAAVQVGVTLFGFLSAAVGADQLGEYLIPYLIDSGISDALAETISLVGLTLIIAYFSLVFGELVPKRVALAKAEALAPTLAIIVDNVAKVFRPLIWLLSRSTNAVVRLFGIDPSSGRQDMSEEELIDLVSGHQALTDEERDIVEEVFNASETQIHEVMRPRTEVDFLDASLTIKEAITVAVEKAHSRYPVVRGSSDEVIGFIHVRDLLDPEHAPHSLIRELVRPIIFLPGTKGVLPALTEMRAGRQQIAIVLDEYGGTDGIVTLEDLVETMIGEIHDEYDESEKEIETQPRTGELEVDGLVALDDLAEEIGRNLPDGPYETLSGLVMHHLGRMPEPHDVVHVDGFRITVIEMEGKRVGRALVTFNGTNSAS